MERYQMRERSHIGTNIHQETRSTCDHHILTPNIRSIEILQIDETTTTLQDRDFPRDSILGEDLQYLRLMDSVAGFSGCGKALQMRAHSTLQAFLSPHSLNDFQISSLFQSRPGSTETSTVIRSDILYFACIYYYDIDDLVMTQTHEKKFDFLEVVLW
jgi:hypothetical protein